MRKVIVAWLCAILVVNIFGLTVPTNASAYTPHDPIYIDGNADFTLANGVSNPGATGDETDPYIIEDWDIHALSANGIEICNTDAYFTIRNCYIHDGSSSHDGISFYNVQNGSIDNTNLLNNYDGIYLVSSSNNTLANNIINSNNFDGISLWESSYNNISNNNINSNNNDGIYQEYSNYNIMYNNYISSNDYGIEIDQSNNNIILNNDISNSYNGILLFSSTVNMIIYNNISSNIYSVVIFDSNCKNNIFHHNSFFNGSVVNVIDSGADTRWDDNHGEGNYWSNYMGLDDGTGGRIAGDGVGDTNIPHMGLDNYPLMVPWIPPETTPPSISSVSVSDITTHSAVITWITDEDSDSRVNYSVNSDLSSNSTKYDSTITTTHSITLTGLSHSTIYYFEVISTDVYGNTATDTNNSNYYRFTTSEEDTIPPVISSVSVSEITANSAIINWMTNENSDSKVNYSINGDLSSNSTLYNNTMTTSHSIILTSLSGSTIYYFEVVSTDGSGNTATDTNNSNYYRFTTSEQETTPPVISSVSVSEITAHSAVITWITDEKSDSRVNYSVNADLSFNSTEYYSLMTTNHLIVLENLNPSTTYYFEVSATDGSGNTATDNNNLHYFTFTTETGTPSPGESFSILDYLWVMLLVILIIIIVVIAVMVWRKKGKGS